jgi:hypothetical protein
MRRVRHFIGLVVALGAVAGCAPGPEDLSLDPGASMDGGGAGTVRGADAGSLSDAGSDAGSTGALAMYPSWQLIDIQPLSSRFNTAYGLNAFLGRPLVVLLLEGF